MISSKPSTLSEAALAAHADFVRKLARRLVRDEHQVDDLVQETWLAALRQRDEVRGSLRAWLARVMGNLAATQHRSRARRERRESWAARDEAEPSIADVAAQASGRVEIVRAVLTLAEPYRSAVLLRYYEDLGPSEIAARLALPVETVRTRLKRGLALLRMRLERRSGRARLWAWPALAFERVLRVRDVLRERWAELAARVRSTSPATKVACALVVPLLSIAWIAWWASSRTVAVARAAPSDGPSGHAAASDDRTPFSGDRGALEEQVAVASTPASAAHRALSGRTFDENGRPLAGVELRWWSGSELDDGEPDGIARSDATGRYELLGLPETFVVDASCGERRAVETLDALELAPGSFGEVDFHLDRPRRIAGTVLSPSELPVPNALLATSLDRTDSGYRAAHHAGLTFIVRYRARAISDERGAFALDGLPSGTYGVTVTHADFPAASRRLTTALEPAVIRMSSALTNWIEVADASGAPIAGARVTTRGVHSSLTVATTDEHGRCELPPRAEGSSIIARIEREGFGTLVAGPLGVREPAELHRVRLEPPRSVDGRLADARGEPIAAAELTARFAIARPPAQNFGANPLRDAGVVERVRTDAHGEFHFAALPHAQLAVDVRFDGERFPRSTHELAAGATQLQLALERDRAHNPTLDFDVRDGLDRRAVTRFTLTGLPQSGSGAWDVHQQSFDAPDGRASWNALGAGAWLISVDAPGYASSIVELGAVDASGRDLTVELWPLRDLRVRVVDAAGSPRRDAVILVTDAAGQPLLAQGKQRQWRSLVTAGPAGDVALCGLPATVVQLEVLSSGGGCVGPRFELDLTRPLDGVRELVIDAQPPATRRLTLSPPERWRAQRVDIELRGADEHLLATYVADASAAGLSFTGGRRVMYCHRGRGGLASEVWFESLPRAWLGAEQLGPGEIEAPTEACWLDVRAPGEAPRRVRVDAGPQASTIDLAR